MTFENEVAYININDVYNNTDQKTFVVEASLVMMVSEEIQLPRKIVLTNFDTQVAYEFTFKGVNASADGKIVHWHFWPTKTTLNDYPEMAGYGLKVYND